MILYLSGVEMTALVCSFIHLNMWEASKWIRNLVRMLFTTSVHLD